jgi:hypothetical protein
MHTHIDTCTGADYEFDVHEFTSTVQHAHTQSQGKQMQKEAANAIYYGSLFKQCATLSEASAHRGGQKGKKAREVQASMCTLPQWSKIKRVCINFSPGTLRLVRFLKPEVSRVNVSFHIIYIYIYIYIYILMYVCMCRSGSKDACWCSGESQISVIFFDISSLLL